MVILLNYFDGFDIQLPAGKNLQRAAITIFTGKCRAADGPSGVAIPAAGYYG